MQTRRENTVTKPFFTLVAASAKLTSRHGRFTDGNRTPGTHSTDNWVGPGASLTVLEKIHISWGIAVAQWLRCCATNRKVTGSIPDGVIGIFH